MSDVEFGSFLGKYYSYNYLFGSINASGFTVADRK